MSADPKDAALRERVRKTIAEHGYTVDGERLDRITDRVLAAIPEPAATPEPPRVELDGGWFATWKDGMYTVHGPDATPRACWSTAASIANHYIAAVSIIDAKVLELLALKGQGEPCAPSWWAKMSESGEVFHITKHQTMRDQIPFYTAATPRAPQKVEWWIVECGDGVDLVWREEAKAREYAGYLPNSRTVHAVAPLVRGDVTEGRKAMTTHTQASVLAEFDSQHTCDYMSPSQREIVKVIATALAEARNALERVTVVLQDGKDTMHPQWQTASREALLDALAFQGATTRELLKNSRADHAELSRLRPVVEALATLEAWMKRGPFLHYVMHEESAFVAVNSGKFAPNTIANAPTLLALAAQLAATPPNDAQTEREG